MRAALDRFRTTRKARSKGRALNNAYHRALSGAVTPSMRDEIDAVFRRA